MGRKSKLRSLFSVVGIILYGVIAGVIVFFTSIAITGSFGVEVSFEEIGSVELILSLIATQIGLLISAGTWLAYSEKGKEFVKVRYPSGEGLKLAGIATVGLFVFVLSLEFISTLLEIQPPANEITEQATVSPELISVLIVLNWVLVAPAEELLFRGVIQSRLKIDFDVKWAIFLTAVIFTSIHVPNVAGFTSGLIIPLMIWFTAGVVLGYVFEKTESIVTVIIIHGVYNTAIFLFLFIETFVL